MNAFAYGLHAPTTENDRFLLSQQVILARRQMLTVGLVSSGVALLIIATFAGTAPAPVLAMWIALAAFGLAVTRSALRLRRKKTAPSDPHRSAQRLLFRFVGISALWGTALWFTMPMDDVGLQFLLIFLAAGSAAGLVAGFGPIPALWAPMIVLTVVPPAVRQCLHAERIDLITCIGLLLFVAALFFFGGNAFR